MEAATEAPYTPHSLRYGVPLPSRANATNDDLASLDLRDEHSNIEVGNRASSLAAAKAQDTSLRVQHEITLTGTTRYRLQGNASLLLERTHLRAGH
jgi:hypothetical protein